MVAQVQVIEQSRGSWPDIGRIYAEGARSGRQFRFGEQLSQGRRNSKQMFEGERIMPNNAPTNIQQQGNVHPLQAREAMEKGLPQLQMMAIQVRMQLVLDLNRLQGLKLWSQGRISSSKRHEHNLRAFASYGALKKHITKHYF